MVANLMFNLPAVTLSTHSRSSSGLLLGEFVATFGLILVILGVVRSGRSAVVAFAVGGYITAAYWFTSSTSFANPAVTIGRTLSNTFAGIAPASAPVHRHAGARGPGRRRARPVAVPVRARRRSRRPARRRRARLIGATMTQTGPTVEQHLALRTAAERIAREFSGVFGKETIELFLTTSWDQLAEVGHDDQLPARLGGALRP